MLLCVAFLVNGRLLRQHAARPSALTKYLRGWSPGARLIIGRGITNVYGESVNDDLFADKGGNA